ncbi:MAG: ABC transporter substrate-binding protein [Acidimicrobiales bacterium]
MSIGFSTNGRVRPRGPVRCWSIVGLVLVLFLVAAACGDDDDDTAAGAGAAGSEDDGVAADGEPGGSLRLGYFPNVTHAPAIIGVEDGILEESLGAAELELSTFPTGTEAIEALLSDSIDATFIGPNPAINGFAQSNGEAVRIVAGTTSGGAALVVREGLDTPEDLAGATLSTPSLGNTQDVALRAWLAEEGYETDTSGGGDVQILNQENADTLTAFRNGDIDGGWVPEPWSTRLVLEGGGHVLVDEAELWPDGQLVTTHLIVRTDYLEERPANIQALLAGLLDAIDVANDDVAAAQTTTNAGIEEITDRPLADETIQGAWENLTFTPDPIASSLEESKDDAVEVGLLDDVDLGGIYDLTLLNELLTERGEQAVEGL